VELYGIASRESADVHEWRPSRDEAEKVLALVLEKAPELTDDLYLAGQRELARVASVGEISGGSQGAPHEHFRPACHK
jgi:hypothetical protein